jgi:hypothetical protein
MRAGSILNVANLETDNRSGFRAPNPESITGVWVWWVCAIKLNMHSNNFVS